MIKKVLVEPGIVTPGIYKHFKGNLYYVIGKAISTEDGTTMVVYISVNDGTMFTRPSSMFFENVDKEKYPEATQTKRFELMEEIDELHIRFDNIAHIVSRTNEIIKNLEYTKSKYEDVHVSTGETNVYNMVDDCIGGLNDLLTEYTNVSKGIKTKKWGD